VDLRGVAPLRHVPRDPSLVIYLCPTGRASPSAAAREGNAAGIAPHPPPLGAPAGCRPLWGWLSRIAAALSPLLLGATLSLRRCPPPLGPPTDLMPGHLSPACGRTTLNATHLRAGQSRRSAPSASFGLPIVRSARPSTPEVLLAWWRSLAGRQPHDLGEDVGRVAGSTTRAQHLGGLDRDDGKSFRRAVPMSWLEWNMDATLL
jgi:hypothetical protein